MLKIAGMVLTVYLSSLKHSVALDKSVVFDTYKENPRNLAGWPLESTRKVETITVEVEILARI